MSRITISLDARIVKEIEEFLKKMERTTSKSWSVSKTINILLLSGMLYQKRCQIGDLTILKDFIKGKKIDSESISLDEMLTNLVMLDKDNFI